MFQKGQVYPAEIEMNIIPPSLSVSLDDQNPVLVPIVTEDKEQ